MRLTVIALFSGMVLSGCQSRAPVPIEVFTPDPVPEETPAPEPPVIAWPDAVAAPEFDQLPGWSQANIEAPLSAFKRSCLRLADRDGADLLAAHAPWAGRVEDWRSPCQSVDLATDDASARRILETEFVPVEVMSPSGESRFTGYFEPMIEARYTPTAPYTEPVPAVPADLDPNGGRPVQVLRGGQKRPYPARAQITSSGVSAIAYAHPADVFFLQIQGSGRLIFPDGRTIRASYGANNGHPFKSTANWLMRTGRISAGEASMQGIRAWMDRAGARESRLAMNQNPRFVFFNAEPEGDPSLGPKGAQEIPLTPLGSMAVDTSIHPLGVPMYVETTAPGLGGDWAGLMIAQDTGGAIKGPVRGDIYFGTGDTAGDRAGTMNAPGRLWILLPRPVAERVRQADLSHPMLQTLSP